MPEHRRPAVPGAAREPRWVLDRTPPPLPRVPVLDPAQQEVVDHVGGPLLVLAGPGTGKTTTLVEAVVARVHRGLSPEQVLVLTFSRKAADELRERISGRLAAEAAAGRPVPQGSAPSAWTFHAWCLALLRTFGDDHGPLRLLSGAERQVRVRELLAGSAAGEGTTRWPATLRAALPTAGMAREVSDLLDRARERGVEPEQLAQLGERHDRPAWVAGADFLTEYWSVLGSSGEMDYGELVRATLLLLEDPDVLAEVRSRYRAVFVDEYQDTDPAQEELLALLAGRGGDLVCVGDPDQSIYGFRGADPTAILGFADRFPTAAGAPAPVVALTVSRRAGATLLAASRAVASRVPAPLLSREALSAHRSLRPVPGADPGTVAVRLYGTVAEETAAIADVLRRAHLEDGLPWSAMAVLVRSGRRSMPLLRRALGAAGVPLAAASDEVPVARDPAVQPLLWALRAAADPDGVTEEQAVGLLAGPLVQASPGEVRRLGRVLRAQDRAAAVGVLPVPPARPSGVLLREAVGDPFLPLTLPEAQARLLSRLQDLLGRARELLADGGGAQEALWVLWDASGMSRRLQQASARGGARGRAADRDLDAVVALFAAVTRFADRRPRAGVTALLAELEAQEIPSRAEGSVVETEVVRILTAHRSKGLEWPLVVVAGVQEGVWPDLRRRGSLLEADRIGPDGLRPETVPATLLAEERRLFYVACTRASRTLVLTAVDAVEEDGDRPSRLLDELGPGVERVAARAPVVLSLPSLVGRLRAAAEAPDTAEAVRTEAAGLLARLSRPEVVDGRAAPPVPGAAPESWWGLAGWSPGAVPVRDPDEPVRTSASMVQAFDACPLAWFLEREARAQTPSSSAQGFGSVLHVLARLLATEAVEPTLEALLGRLDQAWPSLGFEAPWQRVQERAAAERALRRLLAHHASGRPTLGAELEFEIELAGAVVTGSVDRVEASADGPVVVDLKTGKSLRSKAEAEADLQLAVYQLVLAHGALADQGVEGPPAGAELVYLRAGSTMPTARRQEALPAPGPEGTTPVELVLTEVVAGVRAEAFVARPNSGCQRCDFRSSCPARPEGAQVVP